MSCHQYKDSHYKHKTVSQPVSRLRIWVRHNMKCRYQYMDYHYKDKTRLIFINKIAIHWKTVSIFRRELIAHFRKHCEPSVRYPAKFWSGYTQTFAWWRHQMETFSTLLAICAGNSPHKGQWRGALMFSLICARINGWVNNGEAGDLRRNRAHYDVIVMEMPHQFEIWHASPQLTKHHAKFHSDANLTTSRFCELLWQ